MFLGGGRLSIILLFGWCPVRIIEIDHCIIKIVRVIMQYSKK